MPRVCLAPIPANFDINDAKQFLLTLGLSDKALRIVDSTDNVKKELISEKVIDKKLTCKKCGNSVSRHSSLGSTSLSHVFSHMDRSAFPSRFQCPHCPFSSLYFPAISRHCKKQCTVKQERRKFKYIDRTLKPENIVATASLYGECYPDEPLPYAIQLALKKAKRTEAVELGENQFECQICLNVLTFAVPDMRRLLLHACSHLDEQFGRRFICPQCPYNTNYRSNHTHEGRNTIHDRLKDSDETELHGECARLFSVCYARSKTAVLPVFLQRSLQQSDTPPTPVTLHQDGSKQYHCQICLHTWKTDASRPLQSLTRSMYFHAVHHIDRKRFGFRFKCHECDFTMHSFSAMTKHVKTMSHQCFDRATDGSDIEYLRECGRVFEKCLPDMAVPVIHTQAMKVANREEDTALSKDGQADCQKCFRSLSVYQWNLFNHSLHHVPSSVGTRFHCKHCHFTTNSRTNSHRHKRDNKHFMQDRLARENMEFSVECVRVFNECFPGREPPEKCKAIIQDTAPVRKESCKKCGTELHIWSAVDVGCRQARLLFEHSTQHVTLGKRFRCTQCEFTCNATSCWNKHKRELGHSFEDRLMSGKEKEFISECDRVFSECFPTTRLPPNVQQAIDKANSTDSQ